jgi:1,2-diacylglycerol-3-alpha-glucose alpha-1,2-glucosyltransferase
MNMKVLLYSGSWNLVKESGVGQALLHQQAMLSSKGIATTREWESDATIIHVNTVFPDTVWAVRKAKRKGMLVVRYAHSTMEDFKHSFLFSNALAPLFRRWIRFLYQQGDVVVTPSSYAKRLLESYGVTKPIFVLSNGVDTTRFFPSKEKRTAFRRSFGLSETELVVISVGLFIERKGILDFLALAKRMPSVTFLWFGYTPPSLMVKQVKQAIQEKSDNVRFPGYIDQYSLSQAYCGADLFVFPSHEETEGIVVLEALSSGVPVIVRDIPVYEDWLIDKQNVYKAGNLEDLQRLISQFSEGLLPDLTEAGRTVAKERSIPAIADRMLGVYRQSGTTMDLGGKDAKHAGKL